jgi:hypothetical protein
VLEFYWRDPEPDSKDAIELPRPEAEWRYYFEPALSLASETDSEAMAAERELADVTVEVHPKIRQLLQNEQWSQAKQVANEQRVAFISEGYQPDGIKLTAGESWMNPTKASVHARSLADFTTTTCGFRFSVHTCISRIAGRRIRFGNSRRCTLTLK